MDSDDGATLPFKFKFTFDCETIHEDEPAAKGAFACPSPPAESSHARMAEIEAQCRACDASLLAIAERARNWPMLGLPYLPSFQPRHAAMWCAPSTPMSEWNGFVIAPTALGTSLSRLLQVKNEDEGEDEDKEDVDMQAQGMDAFSCSEADATNTAHNDVACMKDTIDPNEMSQMSDLPDLNALGGWATQGTQEHSSYNCSSTDSTAGVMQLAFGYACTGSVAEFNSYCLDSL